MVEPNTVDLRENPFAQQALQFASKNKVVDQAKLGADVQKAAKTDSAPSAQAQTQTVPLASLNQLLSKFDVQRIPISRLRLMRRDPMIAFALFFIQAQLLRARWSIKCPDAQVAAFVDNALREIWPSLVMTYMNKLTFGYQAAVKRFALTNPDWTYIDSQNPNATETPVWDNGSIQAVTWKPFVPLPPEGAEPIWDDNGDFNGINYNPGLVQVSGGSPPKGDPIEYDVLRSLWFTNEAQSVHGSLWGYPRIGYAYRFWWSFWFNWGLADRHFEKDADPPTIVRYPPGRTLADKDGTQRDSRAMALLIGNQARSNSTIAMPSDVVVDDQGMAKNTFEWSIEFLRGGGNFEVFEKRFAQLQTMILRSCMVPEEAFQAKGGSAGYNSTGQLQEAFQSSQITLMQELDMDVNRYVIPQIVAANFSDRNVKAVKITAGFDIEDIELAKSIIQGAANSDVAQLQLDMRHLLEAVGLPVLTPAEVQQAQADKQAALEKQAQAMKPDPQSATPGKDGQAGVNNQGLYYDARETINLDDTRKTRESLFLADLMAVGSLRDHVVLADARSLRGVWADVIRKDFSDASALLVDYQGQPLGFDETFFERWQRRASARVQEAVAQTRRVLASVMRRGSTVEFERAGLSDYSWDPLNSQLASDYIKQRGLALVEDITSTTREEIRTLLSDLVSRNIPSDHIPSLVQAHFEFFSEWRADRLVRTEIVNAYNYATLYAGLDAEIEQAQAIDAQLGPARSDKECIDRNGRVFSLAEAIIEQGREHPQGTLQWRLLKEPTTAERLPVPDMSLRPGTDGITP